MSSIKFKVESGIQMMLRLTKKPDLDSFYPNLFKTGPKPGHVIEVYSDDDTSCLLCDIICEALIPVELGGKESSVIVFNTDGKFNLDYMVNVIKKRLLSSTTDLSFHNLLENILSNLIVFDIYDATQLHTTIQTLYGILIKHPNISLVIFDTLTAFYWSEQNFKIMKMDAYVKYLLRIIQKSVKDHKVVTLYTRPLYFSSSKGNIENLEACCEYPSLEHINYRIQVVFTDSHIHHTIVQTHDDVYKSLFKILDNKIVWH